MLNYSRCFVTYSFPCIATSWNFVANSQLFLAGADCFRLNFSHGSQEQKLELLMTIREIEEKYSHPIGILGDLQGPKLRVRIECCLPSVEEELIIYRMH